MSKQVLSIEQMLRLKELGIDISKGSMYWVRLVRLPNVKNKEKGSINRLVFKLTKRTHARRV